MCDAPSLAGLLINQGYQESLYPAAAGTFGGVSLKTPDSYTWHKFQARVLDVAAQELEEKAGGGLRITRRKTGLRITHLKLEFLEQ